MSRRTIVDPRAKRRRGEIPSWAPPLAMRRDLPAFDRERRALRRRRRVDLVAFAVIGAAIVFGVALFVERYDRRAAELDARLVALHAAAAAAGGDLDRVR
jgi:hypothetical protein